MSECIRIQPLLALSVRGDLGGIDLQAVRTHTAACVACRQEESEYSQVILVAQGCKMPADRLPAASRNRIALEAARSVRERSWMLPLPFVLMRASRSILVASAAAIVMALVLLPATLWRDAGPAPTKAASTVTNLDVVNEGGAVKLVWSDGKKRFYKVYKSEDPRRFSSREAHVVAGNVWVDTDPGSAPVFFYRIE